MDKLEVKEIDTKRGFHYRYYITPASQVDTSRPVLLLCHGWPDSAALWQSIVPHLQKTNLRLVIPDLLGYGGSSKPTDPASFEISAMVTDIMEIFSVENITAPILPFGHDWGSYFAQRLYMLNASRMAGLITLNVALMMPNTQPFDLEGFNQFTEQHVGYPVYAYWELFADPEGPKLMDQHLEAVWYAIHGSAEGWMKKIFCVRGAARDWIAQNRKDIPLKPYAEKLALKNAWIEEMQKDGLTSPGCWYRAFKENHQLETEKSLNAQIDKPYLFIGCDGDAVCRTDAIEGVKKAGVVKDLEWTELHSGHWSPLEVPDQISDIVLKWLEKKGFTS